MPRYQFRVWTDGALRPEGGSVSRYDDDDQVERILPVAAGPFDTLAEYVEHMRSRVDEQLRLF